MMRPWTGLSSLTSRVWFNSKTGEVYSANDDNNHSNAVFQNLSLFGLTPEKIARYGIDPGTQVPDYYGPLLYAAMHEGWVRIRIDVNDPDNKSNAEGADWRSVRKAAIWYTETIGMPHRFIVVVRSGIGDHEGKGYPLDPEQLEFFIKKGQLPRDLLKNESAHPMRQWLNMVDEAFIDEAGAGPSRIVTHIRDGTPFIAISAMRGENDHLTNLKRTHHLKANLNALPVSIIEIEGEYEETTKEHNKQKQKEESFFVMPRKALSQLALDKFLQIGLLLCRKYDQEAIAFGDGEYIYMIDGQGHKTMIGDAVTFSPEKIEKLPGFSEIKRRKFSFMNFEMPKAQQHGMPIKYALTGT